MSSTSSTRYLIGVGVAVAMLPVILIGFIASSGTPPPTAALNAQQVLRPDAPIPAKYVSWVQRAGRMCPDIGPALVAAQIDVESSWREDAVAPNPPEAGGDAVGLAQFQDATWKTWGGDTDGDRTNSPRDGEDAIMALAKFMCSNVAWAKTQLANSNIEGETIRIALAAYFCGRTCVLQARGVPVEGKARDYPQQVLDRVPTYGQATALNPGGTWTLPLAAGTYKVGSGFGPRGGRLHAGVDLTAAKTVPIYAASGGRITTVVCNSGNGNCDIDGGTGVGGCGWYVEIAHANNITTRYCHMLRRPVVQVGQTVPAGQQLGVVGSSGNSSGPHLHFEVHTGGGKPTNANAINPIAFLRNVGLTP